ncbi:type II secretion system F family protein [Rhodoplanes sp. TEM]|uniref:Type II secretion system F family protein n=1 Tax=Rhodoplanes tepidamans TaxID=200616 RepID=A0ABT5JCE2_RHOTP|nr:MULTISPECIES: type II secretion system F family protein [Rhodoplanes]MDC7787287.1 type II secretion system F family protein [Rhodoplanes tepidamans]MDC7985315.1 type II secretion system F family protein [Rhodoplanes sp. TEM]MDQ0357822.1 general secretion pathway protein F [Rhodoplanes tepidamans]
MPNFHYRALTQTGELVTGTIAAPNAAEVAQRIEFLGLVPIETAAGAEAAAGPRLDLSLAALTSRPRPADVTVFTRDLALLLRAGARLDDALELLAGDADLGRMRPVVGRIRAGVLSGETFADAIAAHPALFPPVYVALVRVGEASGTLDTTLEQLAAERARAEALRKTLAEALQYPAFILVAAGGVLVFFLLFVLPQFSTVLRDMGAKLDPAVEAILDLSDLLQAHTAEVAAATVLMPLASWLVLRRPGARVALLGAAARLPGVRTILSFRRAAVFCRNLGILLGNGVTLTAALRIIVEVMATGDGAAVWSAAADKVRHGGRLSEALAAGGALPAMAVRMLRLGEETGQLALLAGRIADFYEAKLQAALARVVGIVGPLAIVTISVVVGGLIVSVMTALLSVSQSIG